MSAEFEGPGCRRGRCFLVTGRVQRVGFRAATRRRARALGLTGHARNLEDGRVEVIAAGSEEGLQALREWLVRGPALARVDAVEELGECEARGTEFTAR